MEGEKIKKDRKINLLI